MMYTDNETCMADAALQSLKGGPMNRRAVLHAMGGRGSEHYAMLRTLTDELKLISKGHDTFSLTFEGRKAVQMGFKAYMEERERMAEEIPLVLTRDEPRPWYKLNRAEWIGLAGVVIGLLALAVALLK